MKDLVQIIRNNSTYFAIIIFFAFIGFFTLLFLVFYIPVLLGFWSYQVDPLSLIAAVFIGYFAYRISVKTGNQELIALEEFRPILKLGNIEDTYFTIENEGNFDAYDIKIFLKGESKSEKYALKLVSDTEIVILSNKEKSEKIKLEMYAYYNIYILYKNVSTDRVYLRVFEVYNTSKFAPGTAYNESNMKSLIQKYEYLELVEKSSIKNQINKGSSEIYKELLSLISGI